MLPLMNPVTGRQGSGRRKTIVISVMRVCTQSGLPSNFTEQATHCGEQASQVLGQCHVLANGLVHAFRKRQRLLCVALALANLCGPRGILQGSLCTATAPALLRSRYAPS